MNDKTQQLKPLKTSKQKANEANSNTGERDSKIKGPLAWKQILGTGFILGIIAFLLVAVFPKYTQMIAPLAMLFAIYYITPKLKTRRFVSAFLASSIAGWLGWLSILVFHPSALLAGNKAPDWRDISLAFAIEFIPVWIMFSVLMSWFNIWISDSAIKRREKAEAERRAKAKAEREAMKPKGTFKRKKKKWKKKK
jgi:4-hydroxybenzoate polyprenyltransferase